MGQFLGHAGCVETYDNFQEWYRKQYLKQSQKVAHPDALCTNTNLHDRISTHLFLKFASILLIESMLVSGITNLDKVT